MESQDTTAAIYSEAKSEYTKQLVFNFQPVLLRFFLDRFNEVKTSEHVVSKSKSALSEFQESLSQIPEWNLDKVQRETALLLESIHCDYIEDLITAVFIAHTKILSAIRLHSKPRRRIQITVPKPDHFMHRAMSECSRLMWSNVYLFSDSVSSLDRQKNMTEVNRFLEEGILQAIRNLLPVKSILRDSLQEDDDDSVHIANSTLDSETPTLSDTPKEASDVAETPKEASDVAETSKEVTLAPEAADAPNGTDVPEVQNVPSTVSLVQVSKVAEAEAEAAPAPVLEVATDATPTPSQESNTLVVDTERSVGFTGMDSVFGYAGQAELRPMIEEGQNADGDDALEFLGDSEELDLDEVEELDLMGNLSSNAPLSADDYESL
jgi:hypothetical protein